MCRSLGSWQAGCAVAMHCPAGRYLPQVWSAGGRRPGRTVLPADLPRGSGAGSAEAFSAPSRARITLALENLSKRESTGRASNDKKVFWHRWYPGPDEQPPDDSRNRDGRGEGGGQAQTGRASGRERVGQSGSKWGWAGSLKKKRIDD